MANPGSTKLSFSLGATLGKPSGPSSSKNAAVGSVFSKAPSKAGAKAASEPLGRGLTLGDDSDEEGNGNDSNQGIRGSSGKSAGPSKQTGRAVDPSKAHLATSSAAFVSRQARKLQSQALEIDPNVFEYDELYDGMQQARQATKERKETEAQERKPKYIEAFLQSASTRRLDRLRAEEKMLQHERDKEGDEFADKEKFVTSAYKKQMEEVRKAEEEEKKKEEQDRQSRTGPGMSSFYRNLLDSTEEQHRAAMEASSKKPGDSTSGRSSGPSLAIRPPKREPQERSYDPEPEVDRFLLREAAAASSRAVPTGPVVERLPAVSARDDSSGSGPSGQLQGVELNDDGEIVDHRALLKGGLNITKKAPTAAAIAEEKRRKAAEETRYKSRAVGESASYAERNARERRRLAELMREEEDRLAREREERERKEAERARLRKLGGHTAEEGEAKRKAARERFEERKRRKMEEDAKANVEGKDGTAGSE